MQNKGDSCSLPIDWTCNWVSDKQMDEWNKSCDLETRLGSCREHGDIKILRSGKFYTMDPENMKQLAAESKGGRSIGNGLGDSPWGVSEKEIITQSEYESQTKRIFRNFPFKIGDKYWVMEGTQTPPNERGKRELELAARHVYAHRFIVIFSSKTKCYYSFGVAAAPPGWRSTPQGSGVLITTPDLTWFGCNRKIYECLNKHKTNSGWRNYNWKEEWEGGPPDILPAEGCFEVCNGVSAYTDEKGDHHGKAERIRMESESSCKGNNYFPFGTVISEGKLKFVHIKILEWLLTHVTDIEDKADWCKPKSIIPRRKMVLDIKVPYTYELADSLTRMFIDTGVPNWLRKDVCLNCRSFAYDFDKAPTHIFRNLYPDTTLDEQIVKDFTSLDRELEKNKGWARWKISTKLNFKKDIRVGEILRSYNPHPMSLHEAREIITNRLNQFNNHPAAPLKHIEKKVNKMKKILELDTAAAERFRDILNPRRRGESPSEYSQAKEQ